MGIFNKIKNMFKDKNLEKESTEVVEKEEKTTNSFSDSVEKSSEQANKELKSGKNKEKENVKIYEKGLTKTRQGFVSKLAKLMKNILKN